MYRAVPFTITFAVTEFITVIQETVVPPMVACRMVSKYTISPMFSADAVARFPAAQNRTLVTLDRRNEG